jgi:hypothetical protein
LIEEVYDVLSPLLDDITVEPGALPLLAMADFIKQALCFL